MEWISVKDRLPNYNGYYICTNNNSLPYIASFGVWVENEFTILNDGDIEPEIIHPTHWMPLPEPPQGN